MYQKDYILRMIEMLGELLAGIMGLIRKGEIKKASEKLDSLYYQILKEDASFFRIIPENEMTDTLLRKHNYTNGHLEVLAELFNMEAELCHAMADREGTLEYSRKSLLLFGFIDKEYRTYSAERLAKMELLRNRIAGIGM